MCKLHKTLSAVGIAALSFGIAPIANAAPAGNVITFGDSCLADPAVEDYWIARASEQTPGLPKVQQKNGCMHDPGGIPTKVGKKTGRQLDDYFCAGATLYTPNTNNLDRQIEGAIHDGALTPQTVFIAIQVGFNDTYNNAVNLPSVREGWWRDVSDAAVNKTRVRALNARIAFVSYPTISHPSDSKQCLIHVNVAEQNVDVGVPAFWIEQGEVEALKYAQRAVDHHNAGFVDVRSMTTDRHECAPDDERITAGAVDNRTQDYNLPVHLNGKGKEIIADAIAARI